MAKEQLAAVYRTAIAASTASIIISVAALLATLICVFQLVIIPLLKTQKEITDIIEDIDKREGDLTRRVSVHANQEVAYLLQRIEDFPGTVILATNLKSNIDEAFSRRFQSIIYFPMPDEELRAALWRSMLPKEWLGDDAEELIATAAQTELSGGSIANVVRRCAVTLIKAQKQMLNPVLLCDSIHREENGT